MTRDDIQFILQTRGISQATQQVERGIGLDFTSFVALPIEVVTKLRSFFFSFDDLQAVWYKLTSGLAEEGALTS